MYERKIVYDKETRDFAMVLGNDVDGFELVGFARTYHEAEVTLDQLVFELMTGEFFKATTPNDFAAVEKRMGLS